MTFSPLVLVAEYFITPGQESQHLLGLAHVYFATVKQGMTSQEAASNRRSIW
jgi:hypothetical protein